ncbi:unnamed protein product, partial [Meganyctiphanes norvegica]
MPGLRSLVARRRLSAGAPPYSQNPPPPSPLPPTPLQPVVSRSSATERHSAVPQYSHDSQERDRFEQMHHGNEFNLGGVRSGTLPPYLQEQSSYSYAQQWDNGVSESQRSGTSHSYLNQADSTQSNVQQPDSVHDNADYTVYHPFDSDIPPWPQFDARRPDTPHPYLNQENVLKANNNRYNPQFSLQPKENPNPLYQETSPPQSYKSNPQIQRTSPQLYGRTSDQDFPQALSSHQHRHQKSPMSYETPYLKEDRLSQDKDIIPKTMQNSPCQQQCSPQSSSSVYPSQSSQPFIDSPQSSVHSGSPQNFSNTPKHMESPQYISQYGSPNNPPHTSPQYGSPQNPCQTVKISGSPQNLVHNQQYGSPESPFHSSPHADSPKNISNSFIQSRSPKNSTLSSSQSLNSCPNSFETAHNAVLSPETRLISPNNLHLPKSENHFITPELKSKSQSLTFSTTTPSRESIKSTVPSPETGRFTSPKSNNDQATMPPPLPQSAHHDEKSVIFMPPPVSPPRPLKRTAPSYYPQRPNTSPPERCPTPPPSINDISALGSPNHKFDTSNLRTGLISPNKSEIRRDTPEMDAVCKNLKLSESNFDSKNLSNDLQKTFIPIEKSEVKEPLQAKNLIKQDIMENQSPSEEIHNHNPGTKESFKSPTNKYPEFKRPLTPSFPSPGTSQNPKTDIESSLARRGITITRKAVPSTINQRPDMPNSRMLSPRGQTTTRGFPKSPSRMFSSSQRQTFPKSPWSQAFVDWNPRQQTPHRGISSPRQPRTRAYSPRGRYSPRVGSFPLRAEPPCVSMTSVSSGRPIISTSLSKMVSERPPHSSLSQNDSSENLPKKTYAVESFQQNTASKNQEIVSQGELTSSNEKNLFQTTSVSHTVTQPSNPSTTYSSSSDTFSHSQTTHTNVMARPSNLSCNHTTELPKHNNHSTNQSQNKEIVKQDISRQCKEINSNENYLQYSESSSQSTSTNVGNFEKKQLASNSLGENHFESSYQANNSGANKYENCNYQNSSKSNISTSLYEDNDPVKKLSAMLPPTLSDAPRRRCDTPFPKMEDKLGDFNTHNTPYMNSVSPQIPSNYRKNNQYTYSTLLQNLQAERNATMSSYGQVINPMSRNSSISQFSNHSPLQSENNSDTIPYGSSSGTYASNSSSKNPFPFPTSPQMSEISRNLQQYYPPSGSQRIDQRSMPNEYMYARGQEEFISSNIRRDLYPYSSMAETMNTSSIPQYNYPLIPSLDVSNSSQYNDFTPRVPPSRVPQGYISVSRPATPVLPVNFSDQDIPQQSSNYQYYNKTDSREGINSNLSQGYTYGLIPQDVNRTDLQSDYCRRMFTTNPTPAPELEFAHRSTEPIRDYSKQDMSQLSLQMNYSQTTSQEGNRPSISQINESIEQPPISLDYSNRSLNQVQELSHNFSSPMVSPNSLQNISQEYNDQKVHGLSNDTVQEQNYTNNISSEINSNTNFRHEYSGPILSPSGEFPDISQEYYNQAEQPVGSDMEDDQITPGLPDVLRKSELYEEFIPSNPVSEDSNMLKYSNQESSNISMSIEKSNISISSNDANSLDKSYNMDQCESISNSFQEKELQDDYRSNKDSLDQSVSDWEHSQEDLQFGRISQELQYSDQENESIKNSKEKEQSQSCDSVPVEEEPEISEIINKKDICMNSLDDNLKLIISKDKSNSGIFSASDSPSSSFGSPASKPSPNSQDRIVIKMKRSDVRIKEESGIIENLKDSSKGNPKPLWTIDSIISKREDEKGYTSQDEDDYENPEYSYSENGNLVQESNNDVNENKMSVNGNECKNENLDSNKNHMKSLVEEKLDSSNINIKNEADSSDSCLDNNSSGVDHPSLEKLSSPTPSLESCSSVSSINPAAGTKRRHSSGHGDSSYASAESNDESTSVKNCKIVIQRNHRSDSYSCYSLSENQRVITERDRRISEGEQALDTQCKGNKIKRKSFESDKFYDYTISNIKQENFKEPEVYTDEDSLSLKELSILERRRRYSEREKRISESETRPKRRAAVEA